MKQFVIMYKCVCMQSGNNCVNVFACKRIVIWVQRIGVVSRFESTVFFGFYNNVCDNCKMCIL